MHLLGLKDAILRDANDGERDENAEKNEDAYAELIQFLNNKSLSLIMREAAEVEILREH